MDDAAKGEPMGADARRAAVDEMLVEALAHGFTYEEAGALAGVVKRTVQRRHASSEFRRRVSVRRSEVVAQQVGLLTAGTSEAIAALQQEMRSAERSSDRIRAAAQILGFALRFRHAEELEVRLLNIEERLGLVVRPDSDVRDVEEA
jgi:hypothetical protein